MSKFIDTYDVSNGFSGLYCDVGFDYVNSIEEAILDIKDKKKLYFFSDNTKFRIEEHTLDDKTIFHEL